MTVIPIRRERTLADDNRSRDLLNFIDSIARPTPAQLWLEQAAQKLREIEAEGADGE